MLLVFERCDRRTASLQSAIFQYARGSLYERQYGAKRELPEATLAMTLITCRTFMPPERADRLVAPDRHVLVWLR